jgi:hypothetical protein
MVGMTRYGEIIGKMEKGRVWKCIIVVGMKRYGEILGKIEKGRVRKCIIVGWEEIMM